VSKYVVAYAFGMVAQAVLRPTRTIAISPNPNRIKALGSGIVVTEKLSTRMAEFMAESCVSTTPIPM
jgi:hypothetical protein